MIGRLGRLHLLAAWIAVALVAGVLQLVADSPAMTVGRQAPANGQPARPEPRDPNPSSTTTAAPTELARPSGPSPLARSDVEAKAGGDAVGAQLRRASDCDQLLDWFRDQALGQLDGQGHLSGPRGHPAAVGVGNAGGAPGDGGPVAANDQVAGVAEPDRVAHDNNLLVTLVGDVMHVVTIGPLGTTEVVASVADLPHASSLLLVDRRAVVIALGSKLRQTQLLTFDLSVPEAPTRVSERTLAGALWSARAIGSTVHVLTGGHPELDFDRDESRASDHDRETVRSSVIGDWIPDDVACDDVHLPPVVDALATSTLHTFDPAADAADPPRTLGVVGPPDAMYASARSMIVTTPIRTDTAVHRFELGSRPTYTGSAVAAGRVAGPWNLDEQGGTLRVVSHHDDRVRLTVFDAAKGLVELATVDDFPFGQTARGIRFVGDIGFIVTFRRIDPLHVVDLSDPRRPRVRGVLETPGFASYLHPLAGGLLFGIAVDGENRPQVVTYDVSDLDRPSRPGVAAAGDLDSLDSHHRAVAADVDRRLFVLSGGSVWRRVAVVVTVNGDAPVVRGQIDHDRDTVCPFTPTAPECGVGAADPPDDAGEIRARAVHRSVLTGTVVLTLSDRGILTSRVSDLRPLAWTPLGG